MSVVLTPHCLSTSMETKPFEKEITGKEKKAIIPLEIFFNIISFLQPQDLSSASKVCRSWNWALGQDSVLWNVFSKKYLFKTREEMLTKIAWNIGKDNEEAKQVYFTLLKAYDEPSYFEFKSEFDIIPLKKIYFYNYFINNIKEVKKELKDNRPSKEWRDKYEKHITDLIFIFMNDPRTIMLLNSVNFSGFKMTVKDMESDLEIMITSSFYEGGKALFEIVKNQAIEAGTIPPGSTISGEKLAFPKYKYVSSYDLLKQALGIYIRDKNAFGQNHGKKRQAPCSD